MDFDAVADELYAGAREAFIPTRQERAAQARTDGDRALATRIKQLRKPSTAAWLINRLAREHPDDIAELADLGRRFRDAHTTLDGERMRALARERTDVVQTLLGTATAGQDVGKAVTDQMRVTFEASLTDPTLADEIATGRLATTPETGADPWLLTPGASVPPREPRRREPKKPAVEPRDAHRERQALQHAAAKADDARTAAEAALTRAREVFDEAKTEARDVRIRLEAAEQRERRARESLAAAKEALDESAREADAARDRLRGRS